MGINTRPELLFRLQQKLSDLGYSHEVRSVAWFRQRYPNAPPMGSNAQIQGVVKALSFEKLEQWKAKSRTYIRQCLLSDDEVYRRWASGGSLRSIAVEAHVSATTIGKIVKRMQIKEKSK
jgi:hypothetical protein